MASSPVKIHNDVLRWAKNVSVYRLYANISSLDTISCNLLDKTKGYTDDDYIYIVKKFLQITTIPKYNYDKLSAGAMKLIEVVIDKSDNLTKDEFVSMVAYKDLQHLLTKCIQKNKYIFNSKDIVKIIPFICKFHKETELKNTLIDLILANYKADDLIFRTDFPEKKNHTTNGNNELYKSLAKDLEYNHFTIDDHYFYKVFAQIIDKSDTIFKDSALESMCCSLPYSVPVIHALIGKGCKLNTQCLRNACKFTGDAKSLGLLLSLDKDLKVDKFCLYDLFDSLKYMGLFSDDSVWAHVYGFDIRGRVINHSDHYNSVYGGSFTDSALTVLLNSPYCATKEDVIQAIKMKIKIPKKYINKNVEFDEEIVNACKEVRFYPVYNFKNVLIYQWEFYRLCLTRKLKAIDKFYREHRQEYNYIFTKKIPCNEKGVIIDDHCFEIPKYFETIQKLIELGGRLPYETIWYSRGKYSKKTHTRMQSDYKKQVDADLKRKEELEKENILLKEKIEELKQEKIQMYHDQTIDLSRCYNAKIPEYKRKKIILSKRIAKDWLDCSTIDKYSFLDVKNLILALIDKGTWKTMVPDIIQLHGDIIEIEGGENGKYFHIRDIDMVAAMCYNY